MKEAAEEDNKEDSSTDSKEAEEENIGVEAAKSASSIEMPYYRKQKTASYNQIFGTKAVPFIENRIAISDKLYYTPVDVRL